jgi:hypothetical protein
MTAAEAGLRLAGSLAWFWVRRGYFAEGLDALETALADGADLPAAVRAEVLADAAGVATARGYGERAEGFRRAALGEAGFAALWAEGRALSLEEAIDFALETSEA